MTEPRTPDPAESGPNRRCVGTGTVRPKEALVRCVVAPDGSLVPDYEARLPGRGLYVSPSAVAIAAALKKRAFARAARQPVTVPVDLAARLDQGLAGRAVALLGLARRAGQVVLGFDQVEQWLRHGRNGLLLQAADAAEGGRAKLRRLAGERLVLEVLGAAELASPFGRDHVVHVGVAAGGLAGRLRTELARLAELRGIDGVGEHAGVNDREAVTE